MADASEEQAPTSVEPTPEEQAPTSVEPTPEESTSVEPTPEEPYTMPFTPAPPPAPISLADIVNSVEVVRQKELADKGELDRIGNESFESLRSKLVLWATAGFPNVYPLLEIAVVPPAQCSDGVVRGLADYIVFSSGKSISEHVALLQAKLADMTVSYANMGSTIAIVVSKD